MRKIYIVTSGSYSDYGIDGVFDSEELAQAFINSFATRQYSEFNGIEEYVLNPCEAEIKENKKAFRVRMRKDGFVSDTEHSDSAFGHKYGT